MQHYTRCEARNLHGEICGTRTAEVVYVKTAAATVVYVMCPRCDRLCCRNRACGRVIRDGSATQCAWCGYPTPIIGRRGK